MTKSSTQPPSRQKRGFAMIDALTAIALAGLAFSALIETRALSLNIATITVTESEALFYAQALLEDGVLNGGADMSGEQDGLLGTRRISDYYHAGVLDARFEEVIVTVTYQKRRQTDTIELRSLRARGEVLQ